MELTIAQLLNATEALGKLSTSPMPARTSFRLGKIILGVEPTARLAQEKRIGLIKKFGATEGENIVVPQEKQADFFAELKPLLDEVVEIPDHKVKLDDIQYISITPADIIAISPFVEE